MFLIKSVPLLSMKLAALFSGGKDSVYALLKAIEAGHSIERLVTVRSTNRDSYMYHLPNIALTELSAEALGMPLVIGETAEEKEKELGILEELLSDVKKSAEIEGVVSGAVASNYQKERVDRIAEKLGLESLAPLWHRNERELLEEMIAGGLEIIVAGVYAGGLDEKWLGRKLDSEALAELEKLKEKFDLSLVGEGGEIETLVIDAPMFSKRISIEEAVKEWDGARGELKIKKASLAEK